MKNILTISTDAKIAEGELSTSGIRHINLAKHFDNYVVIIMSSKAGRLREEYHFENVHIYCTNALFKKYSTLSALNFVKTLHEQYKFSILTVEDPLHAGLVGSIAKRLWNIPLCVQIPSTYNFLPGWEEEGWSHSLGKQVITRVLNRAGSMRIFNHRLTGILKEAYPKISKHIVFIPPMTDTGAFFRRITKKQQLAKFITVSELCESKNLDQLLEVFAKLSKIKPELTLTIVGDGAVKGSVKQHIQILGIQKSVKMVQAVDDEQLVSCFDQADVYVSASDYEGWDESIIKAMAFGLPVVATKVGCFADDYLGKNLAQVVEPKHAQAFQEAMLWCLLNPEKALEMARGAQEAIKECIHQKELEERFVQLLNKS